jgi:hypothetical protein
MIIISAIRAGNKINPNIISYEEGQIDHISNDKMNESKNCMIANKNNLQPLNNKTLNNRMEKTIVPLIKIMDPNHANINNIS